MSSEGYGDLKGVALDSGTGTKFLYATATPVVIFASCLSLFPDHRRWLLELDTNALWLTLAVGVVLAFPIGYTINAVSYFALDRIIFYLQEDLLAPEVQRKLPRHIRIKGFFGPVSLGAEVTDKFMATVWDMRTVLKRYGISFEQERALAVFCRNLSVTLPLVATQAAWKLLLWQALLLVSIAIGSLVLCALIEYYCVIATVRRVTVVTNFLSEALLRHDSEEDRTPMQDTELLAAFKTACRAMASGLTRSTDDRTLEEEC